MALPLWQVYSDVDLSSSHIYLLAAFYGLAIVTGLHWCWPVFLPHISLCCFLWPCHCDRFTVMLTCLIPSYVLVTFHGLAIVTHRVVLTCLTSQLAVDDFPWPGHSDMYSSVDLSYFHSYVLASFHGLTIVTHVQWCWPFLRPQLRVGCGPSSQAGDAQPGPDHQGQHLVCTQCWCWYCQRGEVGPLFAAWD